MHKSDPICEHIETEDLGCTPNGAHLYRKPDGVGGYIYTSDEIGGGVVVWHTTLVSEGTLLAAMACEKHRLHQEYHNNRGWKPQTGSKIELERMAATGGSYISPEVRKDLELRREQELQSEHTCTVTGDRGLCLCGKPVIRKRDDEK